MIRLRAVEELQGFDGDWRALGSPILVVKVVEVTTQTLVEDIRSAESKGAVSADRPASGIDGTSLRWLVELELVVGSNIPSAASSVRQDTSRQRDLQGGIALASNHS